MENIKKIDSAGRLVLGKHFAGSFVSIEHLNPNEINIKLVDVILKSDTPQTTTLTSESFATLIDYLENPTKETPAFLDAKKRYANLSKK